MNYECNNLKLTIMKFSRHLLYIFIASLFFSMQAVADDIPFRVQRREIFRILPINEETTVFLGNSITNFGMWDEFFGSNGTVVNRGISGNLSGEVLEHIDLVVAGKPKRLFLMIGINDFQNRDVVVPNIKRIIELFQRESPATEVYIQSLLPCNRSERLGMVEPINAELEALCSEMGVTYIDVYSKIAASGTNPGIASQYTNDNLHVTAAGYREWTNGFEQYTGYPTCFGSGNDVYQSGVSAFENIMISEFNMLPVNDGDILMVGDYNVQTGEWAELLQSGKVKNRGIGIGFGFTLTAEKFNSCAAHLVKGNPSKIFVQCGARDMAGGEDVASNFAQYQSAVNKIRNIAPDADIYLQTLIPVTDASINSNHVVPFNQRIKELVDADTSGKLHFVDVYSELSENGVLNPKFVGANTAQSRGINGRGYLRWANTLAPYMGEGVKALPELSDEQFNLNEAISSARRKLYSAETGDAPGDYPADALEPLRNAINAAAAVLASEDATAEELAAQATALQAAEATMSAQALLPKMSTGGSEFFYTLSTPRRGNMHLSNEGTGKGAVGQNKSTAAKLQWKFVARNDNSVNIVSRTDGGFLSPIANADAQLQVVAAEPEKGWTLTPTGVAKHFIITNGQVQLHQTNASLGYKIINWGGGANSSDDGCLYLISEAEEPEEIKIPEALLTLTDIALDGSAPYKVEDELAQPVFNAESVTIAVDATLQHNRSEQVLVGSSNSSAAESFVCLSVATANNYGVRYNNSTGKYTVNAQVGTARHQFVMTLQPQSPSAALYIDGGKSRDVNAVVPTLGNISGVDGLYLGGLVCSDNSNKYPMTGTIHSVQFFPGVLTAEQIAAIKYSGIYPTGIEEVKSENGNVKTIYDLAGRKVENPSKGIYIIDGVKRLVK